MCFHSVRFPNQIVDVNLKQFFMNFSVLKAVLIKDGRVDCNSFHPCRLQRQKLDHLISK